MRIAPLGPSSARTACASQSRWDRGGKRGFTLVELMVAVVIIGVLATLATYGMRGYISAAKSSEAVQMIGAIHSAQESYRDETFSYLSVSSDYSTFYPRAPGAYKSAWGVGPNQAQWAELGVQPVGPVEFGYACLAGPVGSPVTYPGDLEPGTPIANWPAAASSEPWFVVRAVGDRDADGIFSIFVGTSFSSEIFSGNELE